MPLFAIIGIDAPNSKTVTIRPYIDAMDFIASYIQE